MPDGRVPHDLGRHSGARIRSGGRDRRTSAGTGRRRPDGPFRHDGHVLGTGVGPERAGRRTAADVRRRAAPGRPNRPDLPFRVDAADRRGRPVTGRVHALERGRTAPVRRRLRTPAARQGLGRDERGGRVEHPEPVQSREVRDAGLNRPCIVRRGIINV